MGETCERCGLDTRTIGHRYGPCLREREIEAAAYERGRRDGIAHAKATATATAYPDGVAEIDWTETDRDERGTR